MKKADFAKMPTWAERKRERKFQEFRKKAFAVFAVVALSLIAGFLITDQPKTQVVKASIIQDVERVKHTEPTPMPVIETPKVTLVVVEIPKCDLSFQDVRVSRKQVITPPSWFSDMFAEYKIENCSKQRWMAQIAFYESEYCKGSLDNCSNVVGAANDSGLFQYIPSTWAASWNPERNNSIFDGKAQFRATSLKYDLGGQGIWSTNKFTR